MRVRNASGGWNAPLVARDAADDAHGAFLYAAPLNTRIIGHAQLQRIKEGLGLEFLWRTTPLAERVRPEYLQQGESPNLLRWHTDWEAKWTPERKGDFSAGLLRLDAPLELLGKDRWLDLLVRFDRQKLAMFVDGVLIDEEWPHGNLYRFVGPFLFGAGFKGGKLVSGLCVQIDHAALWRRALSDAEVAALSGGPEEAARRDVEILGPRPPVGQYWRPRGFNTSVGDCMAFVHGDFRSSIIVTLPSDPHRDQRWNVTHSSEDGCRIIWTLPHGGRKSANPVRCAAGGDVA